MGLYLNFWKRNWKLKYFTVFIWKNLVFVILKNLRSLHMLVIVLISSVSKINAGPYCLKLSGFFQIVTCSTYIRPRWTVSFLRLEITSFEFSGDNVYKLRVFLSCNWTNKIKLHKLNMRMLVLKRKNFCLCFPGITIIIFRLKRKCFSHVYGTCSLPYILF